MSCILNSDGSTKLFMGIMIHSEMKCVYQGMCNSSTAQILIQVRKDRRLRMNWTARNTQHTLYSAAQFKFRMYRSLIREITCSEGSEDAE